MTYFYPRSPRGERHPVGSIYMSTNNISIHAPRVGSDILSTSSMIGYGIFLSTLPAWGATQSAERPFPTLKDFYPRSPRGERLAYCHIGTTCFLISIHAPRVGSDRGCPIKVFYCIVFLSTLPAWGATEQLKAYAEQYINFYPRSPRGERPDPNKGEPSD